MLPTEPIRTLQWQRGKDDPRALLDREWLVTNGLGGYASGTIAGAQSRRYHGHLIAALPGPFGRTLMLGHLLERLRLPDGRVVGLGGRERSRGERLERVGDESLESFRLDLGLPVWRFAMPGGLVVEKRLVMPYHQNTTHLHYRIVEGDGPVRLKVRPSVHFRSHDATVDLEPPVETTLTAAFDRIELNTPGDLPPLRLRMLGQRSAFTIEESRVDEVFYRIEQERGYDSTGACWSPGEYRVDLVPGLGAVLIASTEPWETIDTLPPIEALEAEQARRRNLIAVAVPEARSGALADLVLAADQFLITPAGRVHDEGDEPRTVIAGYHWFTDWGRDTMIALDGLTLQTGRLAEGRQILLTFAEAIRDGLIPNLYPEGGSEGLYHTADATLWFFHAVDRYVRASGDRSILEALVPKLREVVEHHLLGTRYNIRIDPTDGLMTQGEEGLQLTWMDAKVDGWVVTPRRGKAVELNALWYNALCNLAEWVIEQGDEEGARSYRDHAERCRASFNQRFWYDGGGYLFDVVDDEGGGDDASCRPNQIFAISLPNAVLDEGRWASVLGVVRDQLLTPVGLRSLAPGHPDYTPRYSGDIHARDAAYHQGTVWSWLIGPFVDAWLKVHPDDRLGARRFLDGLVAHLDDNGVGSVAEVFDAEPPYTPRGCIAQAWGVAELLRSLILTAE